MKYTYGFIHGAAFLSYIRSAIYRMSPHLNWSSLPLSASCHFVMFSHTQQQLDKRRFILQMGSYYLQAKGEGKDDEFFNVVFVHYCDRWPIDTTKYFDAEFMESDMKRQKAVRKDNYHIEPFTNLFFDRLSLNQSRTGPAWLSMRPTNIGRIYSSTSSPRKR